MVIQSGCLSSCLLVNVSVGCPCVGGLYAPSVSHSDIRSVIETFSQSARHSVSHLLLICQRQTDFILMGSRQMIAALGGNLELCLSNTDIKQVESTKCLGASIDNHLQSIMYRVASNLRNLKKGRTFSKKGEPCFI